LKIPSTIRVVVVACKNDSFQKSMASEIYTILFKIYNELIKVHYNSCYNILQVKKGKRKKRKNKRDDKIVELLSR